MPGSTGTPQLTVTPQQAPVASPGALAQGNAALLKAIQERNAGVVNKLVEAGFAVNAQDEDGNSFLYIAIKKGKDAFFSSDEAASKRIVQILVGAGADVNTRTADGNPVLYSSFGWSSDIVQILVNAGADVNATTADDTTLLYEAVTLASDAFLSSDEARYDKIVEILIDAGAR